MQYDKGYKGTEHWKAISVPQPLADSIMRGETTHFVRRRNNSYRGDVLVVSSPSSKERGGMTICLVEIYDIVKVNGGYLWKVKNPRRVIEYPCQKSTMKGDVWDCYMGMGEIMEYPTRINKNLLAQLFGL